MGKCSVKPLTTAPVEAGDFTDVMPEFGRTPDVEKYFGIKRGTLYNLLDQGKIKGAVLRQAGCLKGVRLWHMASVREHILTQMDDSANLLHVNPLAPLPEKAKRPCLKITNNSSNPTLEHRQHP